jgi:DNA-binding transcriptional MerR regulator
MNKLTIGQLARRVGMRPSALRYYEHEGLLTPLERTDAGYRLYHPDAEQIVRFVQRAQQLGFSLNDIRTLLNAQSDDEEMVSKVAEERYLTLERQITGLLIQRRELELFLQDFSHLHWTGDLGTSSLFKRLVDHTSPAPLEPPPANATLKWLIEHTGCSLATLEEQRILEALRGKHIHIWQDNDTYQILILGHEPTVEVALKELAQLEATCHAHPTPRLIRNEEGYLFTVQGENAFIFARLFLALEQERP